MPSTTYSLIWTSIAKSLESQHARIHPRAEDQKARNGFSLGLEVKVRPTSKRIIKKENGCIRTLCHHVTRDRESPHLRQKGGSGDVAHHGTRSTTLSQLGLLTEATSLSPHYTEVPGPAANARSWAATQHRGLQLKPQSSTKTTRGQFHKRSLEGRFLYRDLEHLPLLIHSGQALYEFTRQCLQPAASPRFHIFVRAPSCLRRQDGPKPHFKSEGLVRKHKAT